MPNLQLRTLTPDDWARVREIYAEDIATGDATFETVTPEWPEWDRGHLQECRLVAEADSWGVVGWAALSPVSSRCVYGGVGEVSVYVSASARGHGAGQLLLASLMTASEAAGLWTLQAVIFPENAASVALHERCGFHVVERRVRLGKTGGRWRDVLLLERRSKIVGI